MRPIGDVGGGLGALRAARRAVAEVDAAPAALVVGGGDGRVGRPPVPAELVHRLAEPRARFAQRQRRHRRLLRRIGGIARQPRDAHHAVVLGEERLQRRVVDRPVLGDAVERAHLEVGRMQARKMRGVHDGGAADAVEVHHLDRRIGVVDRIVGRPRAAVGIDGEIAEQPRLPVPSVARIVRRLHPVALLEAENPHPGVGKAPRHRGARCSGTDDQDIDLVMHRISPCPQRSTARRRAAAATPRPARWNNRRSRPAGSRRPRSAPTGPTTPACRHRPPRAPRPRPRSRRCIRCRGWNPRYRPSS